MNSFSQKRQWDKQQRIKHLKISFVLIIEDVNEKELENYYFWRFFSVIFSFFLLDVVDDNGNYKSWHKSEIVLKGFTCWQRVIRLHKRPRKGFRVKLWKTVAASFVCVNFNNQNKAKCASKTKDFLHNFSLRNIISLFLFIIVLFLPIIIIC